MITELSYCKCKRIMAASAPRMYGSHHFKKAKRICIVLTYLLSSPRPTSAQIAVYPPPPPIYIPQPPPPIQMMQMPAFAIRLSGNGNNGNQPETTTTTTTTRETTEDSIAIVFPMPVPLPLAPLRPLPSFAAQVVIVEPPDISDFSSSSRESSATEGDGSCSETDESKYFSGRKHDRHREKDRDKRHKKRGKRSRRRGQRRNKKSDWDI